MNTNVRRPIALYCVSLLFVALISFSLGMSYLLHHSFSEIHLIETEKSTKKDLLDLQSECESLFATGNSSAITMVLSQMRIDDETESTLVIDHDMKVLFSMNENDIGEFGHVILKKSKLNTFFKAHEHHETIFLPKTVSDRKTRTTEGTIPFVYTEGNENSLKHGHIYMKKNDHGFFDRLNIKIVSILQKTLVLLFLVLLCFYFFFNSLFTKRVERILDALKAYYEGKGAMDLHLPGSDELSLLATYLNKECNEKLTLERGRAENLKKLEDKKNELETAYKRLDLLDKTKLNFLRQLSHELRTPLNGITAVEILFEKMPSSQEEHETTVALVKDCYSRSFRRLMQLVEHACLLAELDTVDLNRRTQMSVAFLVIISESVDYYKDSLDEKKLTVSYLHCEDLDLHGVYGLYLEAFKALIDIAIHLAFEGSEIVVSLEHENELRIIFTSPKLSETQKASFFEVFANDKPIQVNGDLGLEPMIAKGILKVFGHELELCEEEIISYFKVSL